MFPLYYTPHVEYANVIWSPTRMKYISPSENVQGRAPKSLLALKSMSCEEML